MTEKPRTIPAQYLKEPATLIAHSCYEDDSGWWEVYEHDDRFYLVEVFASPNFPPQTGNAVEITKEEASKLANSIRKDEHLPEPANGVMYTEPQPKRGWFD